MTFNYYDLVLLLPESSSQEYRDKKGEEENHQETPPSESDDSDGDDAAVYGGGAQSSDHTKPISEKSKMDFLQRYFKQLGLSADGVNKILKTADFDGLVEYWNEHGFKKIITMVGAGISTCKLFPIRLK